MTSVPVEQPRHDPILNPWLIRLPILAISGAVLLALILTALVGLYQVAFHDRIVPGVSSDGIALGGLTRDQARAALDGHFTYGKDAVFTFRTPSGDQFWQASAADLGVSFDLDATVAEAFADGHSGSLVDNLVDQALIWLNGRSVTPIIRYDQNVAVQQLDQIASQIDRAPADATLTMNGSDIQATPGQSGRTLDVSASLDRLNDAITSLNGGGEIPLVINETPPVSWDAQAAADQAKLALSAPVTLVADDGSGGTLGPWVASVDQIRALLKIAPVANGDGTYSYQVTVDPAPFRAYLESLAPGLITTTQDARFHFNEQTKQLDVIQPGRSGRRLNIDQTLQRMQQAIFSSNRVVPIAFDYTQPNYPDNVTAAQLGITQMVSQGTTFYTGSTQARKDNIILAASKFDGVIIAPHTIFSFNSILGDVAPEAGYVQGKVIVGGRTIDGVGGGVCQVSTTAFQAAFFAGFPIVERYAHGYRVGYYEQGEGVGMDASIFQPELDFRFLNDTDYSLLIETSIYPAQNAIQFRFYSTNPGRQVTRDPAQITNVRPAAPTQYEANPNLGAGQSLQVDWAAQGEEVRVTRHILDLQGNQISQDVFYSNYQPWGAVVQVPPGDPRLNTNG